MKRRLLLWMAWRLRTIAMRLNDIETWVGNRMRGLLRRVYRGCPEYDWAIAGIRNVDNRGKPEPCTNCRRELATEYGFDGVILCPACCEALAAGAEEEGG